MRFTEYKNEEDLPGDRVRAPRKAVPKKRANDIITPGGYRIPQYLAAKPTGVCGCTFQACMLLKAAKP